MTRMDARTVTYGLGATRVAFGALLVTRPRWFASRYYGRDGEGHAAMVLAAGLGARDLGLGLGTLRALSSGASVRPWLLASGAGDLGDAVTTLRSRDEVSTASFLRTVAMTGGTAALCAYLATRVA